MAKKGGCCPTFKIRSPLIREFLAEFLGTFLLVVFGAGSVAQAVLSLGQKGNFFSINWGWGLGVMLGMLVSGGVSGGHINPAITVAVASLGKFPWRKVPHYLAAQYLGALTGSGVIYLVYWDALVWYEHDRGEYRSTPETASIFSTFPARHLTLTGGIVDQVVGTAMLLLCVCAITDRRNMQVSKQLVPLFIGLTVLGIGICFGFNSGYAINPARDFAPRVFSFFTGWGVEVFSYGDQWWIVPVLATHVGAVLGAWLYYITIELHWSADGNESEDAESDSEEAEPLPVKHGYNGKDVTPTYIQYPNSYPNGRSAPVDENMKHNATVEDEMKSKLNK